SAKEKLMVIYYLERTNNVRATAKCFDIELKQVREWHSKKQELLDAASYVLTLNHGQQAQKAKALAQTDEIKNAYPDIASFKFSINWLSRFLHRNDLSNHRCTTVAQHLPAELAEKQTEFL
ncbi:2732_t:CDS:2, partial [Gigaspora margarita]